MGGPASGKSIQGRYLAAHYDFYYIKLEDLLEAATSFLSDPAEKLRNYGSFDRLEGPVKYYVNLLKEEMKRAMYLYRGFIIDGLPFCLEGAQEFLNRVGPKSCQGKDL